MGDIRVIFEGRGRKTVKAFRTIEETAQHLVKNGYTRISGDGTLTGGNFRLHTRLYKATRSGRYARIDTTSDCGCWYSVAARVDELGHDRLRDAGSKACPGCMCPI